MNNAVNNQKSSIKSYVESVTKQASAVRAEIAAASTATKNQVLQNIADEIMRSSATLKQQNQLDLQAGEKRGLDSALLDRLELTDKRIDAMAEGLVQVCSLADPVGETTEMETRPSGIQVGKMRVPIGVILIIYESRPNVTADAAALCIKSGNVTILRGGSEALNSNQSIAKCIHTGLEKAGLSRDIVQVITTADRDAVTELLHADDYIDIVIPRGGKGLIEKIMQESRIPLIKHLDGVCHVYIHDDADVEMATNIAFNSKAQRFGVCNAMETLLIDKGIANKILPNLQKKFAEKNVELRGCDETCKILNDISRATQDDWYAEYLGPMLAVKIVDDVSQAMQHIEKYGSHHTDSIVTDNKNVAQKFLREVDSSSVMINASTRFADGFEYGLGAEIGISTDKLHARGPVGLEGLTTQKFIVLGDGNIRV
ncbi:MAG: glutamate-5-semialdehyde dehydrogenase [Gammaproteobacteria bacterium]